MPTRVIAVLAVYFSACSVGEAYFPHESRDFFNSSTLFHNSRPAIQSFEEKTRALRKKAASLFFFIRFPACQTGAAPEDKTTGTATVPAGESDSIADTADTQKKSFTLSGQYAHFRNSMTPILEKIDPSSPILGLATKGSNYPVIRKGEQWCSVLFNDKEGWVDRAHVDIVDAPTSKTFFRELFFVVAFIVSIGLLVLLFSIIRSRTNKIKSEWFTPRNKKIKIAVVAKTETKVPRVFTNNVSSLEQCFSEIGFDVRVANNSEAALKLIQQFVPDAIVVDWRIGKNVQYVMEQICISKSFTNSIFVLFYNVPDPDSIQKSVVIPNAHYLGSSFTDRELFKIITPVIVSGEQKQSIRKSVESSALQGDLSVCNLADVFQFIAIGSKTGCLLIEENEPTGILYFHNGIIIYAASKNNTGRKAVVDILNLLSGQFYFVHEKDPKSTNCSIHTEEILLEWAKEKDETSRGRLR